MTSARLQSFLIEGYGALVKCLRPLGADILLVTRPSPERLS